MTKAHYDEYQGYDEYYEDLKGHTAKPTKKVRKWEEYIPKYVPRVEKSRNRSVAKKVVAVDVSSGLCPCGCGKDVPNGHYWATEKCGERAKKNGLYMPMNGEWRSAVRVMRKLNSLKKGKKDG